MGQDQSSPVSRTNLGFAGIDIVRIRGDKAIQKALASGDLVRAQEANPDIENVPWLFRRFFSVSRLYSHPWEYFVALENDKDPSLAMFCHARWRSNWEKAEGWRKEGWWKNGTRGEIVWKKEDKAERTDMLPKEKRNDHCGYDDDNEFKPGQWWIGKIEWNGSTIQAK